MYPSSCKSAYSLRDLYPLPISALTIGRSELPAIPATRVIATLTYHCRADG